MFEDGLKGYIWTEKVKTEDPEPVELQVKSISKNGMMTVNFNQLLLIPNFLDASGSQFKKDDNGESIMDKAMSGRKTVALSALNVTRDVMEFMFILKSDVKPEMIQYDLEIKDWNMEKMDVHVNFSDPLLISKGV